MHNVALRKGPKLRVLNSAGKPFEMSWQEKIHIEEVQRLINQKLRLYNALGYEINITTLTEVVKKISEQKFFELHPADYMPVRVGQGAWDTQLTTYRSYNISDNFETGMLNLGGQNARLAVSDAAVDAVSVAVFYWTKAIYWSIIELQQAAKSGNWDLIAA